MTNKEKYASEILDIVCCGNRLAMDRRTNKLVKCEGLRCDDCAFSSRHSEEGCGDIIKDWSEQKYVEPQKVSWSEIAVDTPILVSDNNKVWFNRHFAKYENDLIYVWVNGCTSWTTGSCLGWLYAKLPEQGEKKK